MKSVRYNTAIQTYMEVFDYLITNNIFVYDGNRDFLLSRIKIDKYGFVEETQIRRGVWDEKQPDQKRVTALRVLRILTDNIDGLLLKADVPISPDAKYAYIHDFKSRIRGEKKYYSSYQELLNIFKKVYNGKELMRGTAGRIIDIALLRDRQVAEIFSKMTPLEKRTIECYAKLEEELVSCTAHLLPDVKYENNLDDLYSLYRMINSNYYSDLQFTTNNTVIDWDTFKECIYLKEEGKLDLHGVYSPWDENPYKSELGLDGKTK